MIALWSLVVVRWRYSNPVTGLDTPLEFQKVETPKFQDSRHLKVVSSSALRTGYLYAAGNIPGTHFCWRLSRLQGHSASGRIMSMKNSNDTSGNRTSHLPACSAVPQPTACPHFGGSATFIWIIKQHTVTFIVILYHWQGVTNKFRDWFSNSARGWSWGAPLCWIVPLSLISTWHNGRPETFSSASSASVQQAPTPRRISGRAQNVRVWTSGFAFNLGKRCGGYWNVTIWFWWRVLESCSYI